MATRLGPGLVLAVLFLVLAPQGARADQQGDVAAAQKLYDEGKRLYNVGTFDEAVVAFEQAYDLYRAPEFLFNIGQCYRNLRNYEKSIFVFESYLREKPTTDKRALVEELIAEMKLEVERQRAQRQEDEAAAQELAKKQREAQLEVLERQKQADLERIERERQERALVEAPPRRPIYKRWWFWTIAGGVAVAAVGGVVLATSGDELPSGSLGTIDGR